MANRPTVYVRRLVGDDRIEIALSPGFTQEVLDVVRDLPGRRYDAERRIWTAPDGSAAIRRLTAAFGPGGVQVLAGAATASRETTKPSQDLLPRVRDAMMVLGYSPSTRKVYLGHLRRFLEWCGGGTPKLPKDPAEQSEAYAILCRQIPGL